MGSKGNSQASFFTYAQFFFICLVVKLSNIFVNGSKNAETWQKEI